MDIVAGLSIMMPIMAREGLFYNLLGDKIRYMDFEKTWWPANMIEEMAIQDRLYFASGEASLGVIKGAICMFFNNDLIADYDLDNPYDLVFSGEWTIDKWNEMASGVYTDTNGNGTEDNEDIVGFFIQNENQAPNFFSAAGILLAERDEDGFPQLKCKTERFVNFMERIVTYMKQPGFTSDRDDEDVFSDMFNTGRALFATGEFGNLETMRKVEFVFGTIPFPKYDSAQENYGSSTRSTFSGLGIPKCGNAEYADIILEAFSSESYRTVSPAYYEIAMKDKYSRDSVSAQMYDMIKAGVRYEEYRWTLERARDAGVQLLRVWNGGGIQETETFYDLCDELGIMVWQDGFPANNQTSNWDHTVLLHQAAMNLFRMRRHPSLVILCGGNEFNPYATDNLSSMAVMEELAEDLAPGVGFIRTTPDRGSAHIYTDMEPTCYRQFYKQIPFLGESGVHSFPCFKSLRQQISEEEFTRPLSDIFSEEFERKNPELRNHFCEFIPSRIPRMLSRASAITDINGISLEDLCEATQVASYEFYEIMIQSMRENYPVTGGLMPWVYRRPSVAVGIQLMDGLGDPIAPYYALKEAYKPLTVFVSLPYVTWAAGEDLPLTVRVVNGAGETGKRRITVRLYDPDFSEVFCDTREIALDGDYQTVYELPAFRLPGSFREKFFFVEASLYEGDALRARSFYWPKVLAAMDDPEFRAKRRDGMQPNLMFEKGPWLKRQIAQGPGTRLTASVDGCQREGCRLSFRLTVKNDGPVPAFPVRPDTVDDGTVCAMEDSFFFLRPGEERVLRGDVLLRDNAPEVPTLRLTSWNAPAADLLLR